MPQSPPRGIGETRGCCANGEASASGILRWARPRADSDEVEEHADEELREAHDAAVAPTRGSSVVAEASIDVWLVEGCRTKEGHLEPLGAEDPSHGVAKLEVGGAAAMSVGGCSCEGTTSDSTPTTPGTAESAACSASSSECELRCSGRWPSPGSTASPKK
eukprot:scaffold10412_cov107-Isochrysis_galbana.AAC.5